MTISNAKRVEAAALCAIFAMDIGWVVREPLIGISSAVIGLLLQGIALQVHWKEPGPPSFAGVHATAIFSWILGNTVWMTCELAWEDQEGPSGILRNLPINFDSHRSWYAMSLATALAMLWVSVAGLVSFNAVAYARGSFRGGVGSEGTLVAGVPVEKFRDLFLMPWLINDAIWALCNYHAVVHRAYGYWVPIGACFGLLAMGLSLAAAATFRALRRRGEAVECVSEFIWVAANMVWFLKDLLTPSVTLGTRIGVVALLTAGLALSVWSWVMLESADDEGDEALPLASSRARIPPVGKM